MLEAVGTYPGLMMRLAPYRPKLILNPEEKAKKITGRITDKQLNVLRTARFIETGLRVPTATNLETISGVLIRGSKNPLPALIDMELVQEIEEHIFPKPEGNIFKAGGEEVFIRRWQSGMDLDVYRVTELGAILLNNIFGEQQPMIPDITDQAGTALIQG